MFTAGFPCQDLSQAGQTRGIEGAKSGLVTNVFRLLDETFVPWVLIENVPFMLQLARGAAMEVLVHELERRDYRWAYRVVDSRAFGLPLVSRRASGSIESLADARLEPTVLSFASGARRVLASRAR